MAEPPENIAPPPGDTPAMRQYRAFKTQHPRCVLFFRMGDFYEMFFDDALLAHKVLGITLTRRTEGVPMAGVPYHAVEGYLRRMIQAGHRVAVCEQMEDAALAKGVVKREVTRVITPGTLTDEALLEEGKENPLAAVLFHPGDDGPAASIAWAELSTGAFSLTTITVEELADELARVHPRELLFVEAADGQVPTRIKVLVERVGCAGAGRPGWQFRRREAAEAMRQQFQVASLGGFGLTDDDPALGPASAIIHYLLETQRTLGTSGGQPSKRIAHLQPPRRFTRTDHLIIDQTSLRSLEIEQTLRSGGTEGSLLGVLQDCITPMGKRLLRQWLCYPLGQRALIEERQRVVSALVDDERFLDGLRQALDAVQDVERILGRIAVGRATPRDLVALGCSVKPAAKIADLLADRPSVAGHHGRAASVAASLSSIADLISAACIDAPPHHMRDGGLIRDGHDAQLDEFRGLQRDSHTWLAGYQKKLIDATGITALKVGFNKIFGYYIELTASNRDKAPPEWSRKQTLKNAERFITPELKDFEGKALSAEQRAIAREGELFFGLCTKAADRLTELQAFAAVVAELDVLACFARRARRFRYVKPTIAEEPTLSIRGGKHPVLDELLGDRFVPNDLALGGPGVEGRGPSSTLALITGPNMAGKSTYIRQAALITLLAQTGSFVPADEATVGLCDRIFTRIGASDELHAGQSTFMVEMTETSNICHHATPRSLVILDEIGRGTSTLDGLSLAWAITEHLAGRGCRTLFATHYHELTALAERLPNVANLHVTVREWQDQIVFLHRIAAGSTDRSYGIHVAKIAGLPGAVVDRANEVLGQLSVSHSAAGVAKPQAGRGTTAGMNPSERKGTQLSLFTEYVDHPVMEDLRKLDADRLSPIEAFERLRKLIERAKDGAAPN